MASEPQVSHGFSPVQGGPFYRLCLHSRLIKPPLGFLPRRIGVIVLFTWLPLLLLSAIDEKVIGGTMIPFVLDVEVQIRLLISLPLLLIAEVVAQQYLPLVVEQFVKSRLVAKEDVPRFDAVIASAKRWRDSAVAEVILLIVVILAIHYFWIGEVVLRTASWYATQSDSGVKATLAGYWYVYITLPVFQFLLLRWYFRLFVWYRLLWQISRIDLQLIPTHPDQAGGLGFIGNNLAVFSPFLLAQAAVVAGLIANRIFYAGDSLLDHKLEIGGIVMFLLLVLLVPLCAFTRHLVRARRIGLLEYDTIASQCVWEFDQKWVHVRRQQHEPIVSTGDISSVADLASAYDIVRRMRLFPFDLVTVYRLALTIAAPMLPLIFTMIPFDELVRSLLRAFV